MTRQHFKIGLIFGLTSLLSGGAMGLLAAEIRQQSQDNNASRTQNTSTETPVRLTPGRFISQEDFTRAAEETVNGVVSVKSYVYPQQVSREAQDYFSDPFFEFFFGQRPRQMQPRQQPQDNEPRQLGLGSGVIITSDGYIVTNNHVIKDAEHLEVTLNDNRNYEATVIGADANTDLALIKIELGKDDAPLHVIPMGSSEDLRLGEWVLAVGNPFGFTSSVTTGVVSAKARNISTATGTPGEGGIEAYIQTDAAVNRGNSGGALVNLRGELVGINTAIYSQTGTYAGCSFAIPTSIVNKVVGDLRDYGAVQRAYLGISFRELTPELVSKNNIKGVTKGIYVAEVLDGTAASEAGIQSGDVITSIKGMSTGSTAELQEALTKLSPGDDVTISFMRDGREMSGKGTLRDSSGRTGRVRSPERKALELGGELEEVPAEVLEKYGLRSAMKVKSVKPGSRFEAAGVPPGLILVKINGINVVSADQIRRITAEVARGDDNDKVLFITGILPSGKTAFYAVDLTD